MSDFCPDELSDLAQRLNLVELAITRNLSDKQIDKAIILATDAFTTQEHEAY